MPKKINRKQREKIFKQCKKVSGHLRKARCGTIINYYEYEKDTEQGWTILNGEAIPYGQTTN